MKSLAIRTKLTIWYSLIFIILVSVMMLYIYITMYNIIMNEEKQALISDSEYALTTIIYDNNVLLVDDIHIDTDTMFALFDTEGHIVFNNIPRGVDLSYLFMDDTFRTVITGDDRTWSMYDSYIKSHGKVIGGIRVMRLQTYFNDVLNELLVVMGTFIPIYVLMSIVIGHFLAKKAFRPVDNIIKTAQRIGSGDLTQRIGITSKDEIGRLSQTIDNMLERLQAFFEREKRFASDASHELRTPLAVIMALAEDALHSQKTEDEYKLALYSIYSQSKDMSGMVTQLLSFARNKENNINLEKTDLSMVINSVVDEMRIVFPDFEIISNIQPGVFMLADQMLMARLFMKLIDNAVKYNYEDGHVMVSLTENKKKISIRVEDNGRGIEKKDIELIFDRHYTTHPDEKRGSGLGLSIVKWIVNVHYGVISVKSEVGCGSTFEISFDAL